LKSAAVIALRFSSMTQTAQAAKVCLGIRSTFAKRNDMVDLSGRDPALAMHLVDITTIWILCQVLGSYLAP